MADTKSIQCTLKNLIKKLKCAYFLTILNYIQEEFLKSEVNLFILIFSRDGSVPFLGRLSVLEPFRL